MRHFLLALIVGSLGLRLTATEQLITVTPQALDGWTLSGVDKNTLAQASHLVLPPRAQLSREFYGSAVILHLVTRPVFSETVEEWPIMEVGPAALALVRKDGLDRIVVVVGERTSIDLPLPAPKSADGPAIELALAYDPVTGIGLVGIEDKLTAFESDPTTKPVGLVLSAGETASWPQDLMQVLLLSDEASVTGPGRVGHNLNSRESTSTDKIKAALDKLLSEAGGSSASGHEANGAARAMITNSAISTLEIYTQPAVRRGRPESVRTLVAKIQSK
jgi:hypothetical protein